MVLEAKTWMLGASVAIPVHAIFFCSCSAHVRTCSQCCEGQMKAFVRVSAHFQIMTRKHRQKHDFFLMTAHRKESNNGTASWPDPSPTRAAALVREGMKLVGEGSGMENETRVRVGEGMKPEPWPWQGRDWAWRMKPEPRP